MSTNKTTANNKSVDEFLASVPAEQAEDSRWIIQVMSEITGQPPVMWGPSIIGFGSYHYRYDSGREGDMPLLAFSPRKGKLALYITYHPERYTHLLEEIGKVKTSKACIYISRLAGIDIAKLRELIQSAYDAEATAA